MVTEVRETGSLIGSDRWKEQPCMARAIPRSVIRARHDRQVVRQGFLAVLSFGGFLGIGDDHYPLPWQSLKYDTNLGGYRTGITENQLKGAPKYGNDNTWNWNDPARARSVNDYYGIAV
jgi:hypothetical protein